MHSVQQSINFLCLPVLFPICIPLSWTHTKNMSFHQSFLKSSSPSLVSPASSISSSNSSYLCYHTSMVKFLISILHPLPLFFSSLNSSHCFLLLPLHSPPPLPPCIPSLHSTTRFCQKLGKTVCDEERRVNKAIHTV